MIKNTFFLLLVLFPVFSAASWASNERFTDSRADSLQAREGTIVFKVKILKALTSDRHMHALLLSTSADRREMYDVFLLQDTIIFRRYFSGCLLSAFSTRYDFKFGEAHVIKLTWHDASTKAFIDDQEIPRHSISMGHDLPLTVPLIRLSHGDSYQTADLQVLSGSDIPVDDADRTFELNATCPRLDELLKGESQEDHKGVKLLHFPDQASRDKIKSFIDLLPEDFRQAVKSVLYVEDTRAPKTGEGGEANGDTMTIILKGSYAGDPNVFFHEAAHIYDFKEHFAMGVPDDKSEWTAITGPTCYLKAADVDEFSREFEKKRIQEGFLAPQGGECPFEDLAIWTGTVYEYYLNNRSMADMVTPGHSQYSPKNKQKLDYLLRQGLISQGIYDRTTSR